MEGAAAIRLGGAVLRANGDDRIVPAGAMLGTSLAAQSAFGRLVIEAGVAGGQRLVPADVELRNALSARGGVSDVTIEGSAAHDFALCMGYAHIPGANRALRIYNDEPSRKSFLVLFLKKERLASLRPFLRKILLAPAAAAAHVARSLSAQFSSAERIT